MNRWLVALWLSSLALVGVACKKDNPFFCSADEAPGSAQHPLQACTESEFCGEGVTNGCEPVAGCLDGSYCAAHGGGAAFCVLSVEERTAFCADGCQNNAQCAALQVDAAVCDTNSGMCVQCVGGGDCDSGLCDVDHTCVPENAVAYAAQNGTGSACTQAVPCSLIAAIAAVNSTVKYIKLAPSTGPGHYDGHIVLSGLSVTIIGDVDAEGRPLAVIRTSEESGANVISIDSAAGPYNVTLAGIAVRDAKYATEVSLARNIKCTGSGLLTVVNSEIDNSQGVGLETSTSCDLMLSRSVVSRNDGGGIQIGGPFNVTNNIIAYNGTDAANFGGVKVDVSGPVSSHMLNHNTIVKNEADFAASGLICNLSPTTTVLNNIIALNEIDGGGMQASFTGGCSADTTASNSSIGTSPVVVANIPFVAIGNSSNFDFHLSAALPSQGKPGSGVTTDIDGDIRSTDAPDIGADER